MFQLVREVQYGIVCLFKSVPPEMMDNNQLLRKSNHCKIVFMDFEVTSFFSDSQIIASVLGFNNCNFKH